jgi:hypothetical protein
VIWTIVGCDISQTTIVLGKNHYLQKLTKKDFIFDIPVQKSFKKHALCGLSRVKPFQTTCNFDVGIRLI